MKLEEVRNEEHLKRLAKVDANNPEGPIRYGDVVFLQHLSSGLFLALHKTPAVVNPGCRRASLKKGSLASAFIIIPRFKVRKRTLGKRGGFDRGFAWKLYFDVTQA